MADYKFKILSLDFSSRVDSVDKSEGAGTSISEIAYLVAHVSYEYNGHTGVADGDVQAISTKDFDDQNHVVRVTNEEVIKHPQLEAKIKALVNASIESEDLRSEFSRTIEQVTAHFNREESIKVEPTRPGIPSELL